MQPQLSLSVIWQDDDVVELQAAASSQHFAGLTQVYTTYAALREWHTALQGFPRASTSRITFTAGGEGAYSCFHADFYCINAVGHIAAQITLESNVATEHRPEEKQRVQLELPFEPAALDEFISALDALIKAESGEAILRGLASHHHGR